VLGPELYELRLFGSRARGDELRRRELLFPRELDRDGIVL
jgi:hypothetical protein